MPKILIVDDDESLRRLMRIELGDSYTVIDTGEPETGLALALEHKPDAILVDLRMPKYSGYELCNTFTSFSRTQNIPVVIVSGEAGGQVKETCKRLGAVDYFEKPIDFDSLRNCLTRVIKQRRQIPAVEVRVQLRVPLRIRGRDSQGGIVEENVTTDDVSLSGFLCSCAADFPLNSPLDVSMTAFGNISAGKALVVNIDSKKGIRRYHCRFVQKTGEWVLQ